MAGWHIWLANALGEEKVSRKKEPIEFACSCSRASCQNNASEGSGRRRRLMMMVSMQMRASRNRLARECMGAKSPSALPLLCSASSNSRAADRGANGRSTRREEQKKKSLGYEFFLLFSSLVSFLLFALLLLLVNLKSISGCSKVSFVHFGQQDLSAGLPFAGGANVTARPAARDLISAAASLQLTQQTDRIVA